MMFKTVWSSSWPVAGFLSCLLGLAGTTVAKLTGDHLSMMTAAQDKTAVDHAVKSIPLSKVQITFPAPPGRSNAQSRISIERLLPLHAQPHIPTAVGVTSLYTHEFHSTIVAALSADGTMHEVGRTKRIRIYYSVVLATIGTGESASARAITLEAGLVDSPLQGISGGPTTVELVIESRLLQQSAPIEATRTIGGLEAAVNSQLVTIDDCNGDKQEDVLVLHSNGHGGALLSGKSLETLVPIPALPDIGSLQFACKCADLDGDGTGEVIVTSMDNTRYFVVSPMKGEVFAEGVLSSELEIAGGVCSMSAVTNQLKGGAAVALGFRSKDGAGNTLSRTAIVDLVTGEIKHLGSPLTGSFRFSTNIPSGRISGVGGRKWLATSCLFAKKGTPTRLFVQEVGAPDSMREILLPHNAFQCAQDICVVPTVGDNGDLMAVTMAPIPGSESPVTCDPVVFVDVSRCFPSRN
jgi:hypothetical protein